MVAKYRADRQRVLQVTKDNSLPVNVVARRRFAGGQQVLSAEGPLPCFRRKPSERV